MYQAQLGFPEGWEGSNDKPSAECRVSMDHYGYFFL